MRIAVLGWFALLSIVAAREACALDAEHALPRVQVVEILVEGDSSAQRLAQAVGSELFARLRVQVRLRAANSEPAHEEQAQVPWLRARLDLRVPTQPAVSVEEGETRELLTRQMIPDVTSLETGVEAALHIVYATAEAALALPAEAPDRSAPVLEPERPPPRPTPVQSSAREAPVPSSGLKLGFDLGGLGRVLILGGQHVVGGAGAMGELRADWGRLHAGLSLLGAVHETTEVAFGDGYSTLRPLSVRLIPTLDARLTSTLHGSFGFGVGLDQFATSVAGVPKAVSPPPMPVTASPGTAYAVPRTGVLISPVLSTLLGVRVRSSAGTFVSLLGSLDFGFGSDSRVVSRDGRMTAALDVPDVRASLVLAASFTSAGAQRFSAQGASPGGIRE